MAGGLAHRRRRGGRAGPDRRVFWLRSRGKESTDDAQVDAHITQIAARVGGTMTTVDIDEQPGR